MFINFFKILKIFKINLDGIMKKERYFGRKGTKFKTLRTINGTNACKSINQSMYLRYVQFLYYIENLSCHAHVMRAIASLR